MKCFFKTMFAAFIGCALAMGGMVFVAHKCCPAMHHKAKCPCGECKCVNCKCDEKGKAADCKCADCKCTACKCDKNKG